MTCEFKYAKNSVKSVYKMPLTHLADLDGTFIVLSGAAGELEQRFIEVDISNLSSPLFVAEPADKKAGVYDLYGNAVIAADGLYDDVYDLQVSADGTVISGYGTDRVYRIYQVVISESAAQTEQPAASEAQTEQPAVSGALMNQPAGDTAQTEQPAEDGSWTCTCGSVNTGKFCPECGTAKPTEVKCAKCGFVPEAGAAPKFCSECGTAF